MLRDEVVDMLWPNSTLEAGRNRLYHTVHLARQALAAVSCADEWVVIRQSRLLLDHRVWCDVHEIERASAGTLSALADDTLHTALSLCRGDWMPQLDLGAPGQAIRQRLRRLQSALLREAVRRLGMQGDTPTLRAHLDHLLRLEPTDEPAHRELMRLDLAAGRRHAALRTFDKISRELTLQLGLKPTAQTRGLAEQASALLAQAPAAGSAGAATPTLVGREPLCQALVQQMRERGGIWNLTGLGGVGKTALARHVAQRLDGVLQDGVVWVRLGDLCAGDTAAAACVRALGLNAHDARSDLQLLASAVQTRPLLLVLDDLDAAADAAALLAALPRAMQCRLVVISRAPLQAAAAVGAAEVAVPALAVPGWNDSPEQARQSAGFALFLMRCTVTAAEMDGPAWQRDVGRLVQRLDGLPLAIELAAARSASMTPGEILDHLERGLHPLADGPLDLASRHRSMQSSLDWSAQLLSAPARLAYAAVAIFSGAFERADAAQLSAASGLTADAMQVGIDELLAAGLLSNTADPGRLRMLHLPRAHARALSVAQGIDGALRGALLQAICTVFASHRLDFESPACAAGLAQVLALEEDAVALLDHARAHEPQQFVQLCTALCESWTQRNLAGTVQRWAPLAISCAQAVGDTRAHLLLQLLLALAWRRAGQPAEAEQYARRLPLLAAQVADKPLAARAALVRSTILWSVGQEREAVAVAQDTITALQLQPQDEGYWTLAMRVPEVLTEPTLLLHLPALRARLTGSPLWPPLLGALCSHRAAIDDWADLLLLADEVVQIGRDTGWFGCQLAGLWHRAACLVGQDRLDAAQHDYQHHLALAHKTAWDNGVSLTRNLMASQHMRQGRLDAARALVGTGDGWCPPERMHAAALRDPLMHATILLLDGRPHAAADHMQKLPLAWLQQADDNDLVAWSELAALMAAQQGWDAHSRQLADDMRRLDGADDHLPVVRRFRDQHFGPGQPLQRHDADALQAVRTRLRAAVATLHTRLNETAATTAAD
jgi:predicted ATPase/DNA-binding SARP family transcriptional activator